MVLCFIVFFSFVFIVFFFKWFLMTLRIYNFPLIFFDFKNAVMYFENKIYYLNCILNKSIKTVFELYILIFGPA